jgi:DNA-binding transcriptional regulator PaaX
MSTRRGQQAKILKILARKKAVSVENLKDNPELLAGTPAEKYALARSLKNILNAGLAKSIPTDKSEFIQITPEGREKNYREELSYATSLISHTWDGRWRVIILDLPESRKSERDALRYLLKKAGFACLKNSIWISPFPFEHFFGNIKKDLGLKTEMMILVSSDIDEATKEAFLKISKS